MESPVHDQPSPQRHSDEAQSPDQQPQPLPPVDQVASNEEQHDPSGGQQENSQTIEYWRELLRRIRRRPQIKLNFLVMLFTGIMTLFTGWQVEMYHLDQRPWVGPSGHGSELLPNTQERVFKIAVQNSGETPAAHLRGQIAARALRKGETFAPNYPIDPTTKQLDSVTTLFPGAPIILETVPVVISEAETQLLKDGEYIWYVYGFVEYGDTFRGTFGGSYEFHCTTFCSFWKRNLTEFGYCPVYNNATDTKCKE